MRVHKLTQSEGLTEVTAQGRSDRCHICKLEKRLRRPGKQSPYRYCHDCFNDYRGDIEAMRAQVRADKADKLMGGLVAQAERERQATDAWYSNWGVKSS